MKDIVEKIYEYSLEEIMGLRFGSYSKYIIQDRAIPDVRDGLKPVQRRIIYSMYKEKNTYDKGYRKSAKTVGDVIGNYHPHGDTSIYDAMVRMSQDWKIRLPYIDMHGNNGSIDGDSPAAYRYTEARLSKISNELVSDLDKNTVEFSPNFDDTTMEPTVLPANYPNILVSGSSGISAGYATNIPPHNLGEVIDATIRRIDSPNSSLETIMNHIKGPDFPTGGIVEGYDGIKSAFETGKGRVIVNARYEVVKEKGKLSIIVNEIPYEVNKAQLVKKIDDIRIDKKIDGITEVRDESDRDGLRIAIDLKKDANTDLIINYLLKNTDLQVSFNYNVVAIDNRTPKQLGLLEILDAYILHKKEVVLKRTEFDLALAKKRLHIVDGLIKCISILDEVIRVIRASKNRSDSKQNIINEFGFTDEQAEAIITLQLYRLSNTDVLLLEEEKVKLLELIKNLELILNSEEELKRVMKEELREVKKEFAVPRMTDIKEEITEIKIDAQDMIQKEDVIVTLSKDGYIKRTSLRSYQATEEAPTLKEGDYLIGFFELNTIDNLIIFTSFGNYLYVPVHTIFATVWKDLGKHVSNLVKLDEGEEIISVVPVTDPDSEQLVCLATKDGMIKTAVIKDFKSTRISKPMVCMKLKGKDKLIDGFLVEGNEVFISTKNGYGLWYDLSEVPTVGLRASGVKAINLKQDEVVSANTFNNSDAEHIAVITVNGTGKRVKISDFDKTTRARRGLLLLREVKTNPYKVLKVFISNNRLSLGVKNGDINIIKATELPIADRYSTGKEISKKKLTDAFVVRELISKEEIKEVFSEEKIEEIKEEPKKEEKSHMEQISLKEIDEKLLTIEDILNRD